MEISKLDEFGIVKVWKKEENLAASLQEMEKMDAILKMKVAEEKRAKLSRIQVEEELREILSKLPSFEMPNRIKLNLEEFMKLLDDAGRNEEILASEELKEVEQEEKRDAEEEKEGVKEKKNEQRRNTNELTFVEKNILLAKCGRGTLSLTTDEESRIENLLADLDSKDATLPDINSAPRKELYGVDDATRSILKRIDQQLEGLSKLRSGEAEKNLVAVVKCETEDDEGEGEKQKGGKERKREKKGSRLEEINKLLSSMYSVSEEEIRPLSEEEMGNLLEESKGEAKEEKEEKEESEKPPRDVVAELVSSAKLLMPKFRYRFQDP